MNPTDEMVKLIEAIVDKKVKAATLNIKNITSAGDLALTSMGDIRINTAGTHKAYYNGTEIVAMSAPGDVIKDTATNNKLLKWTNASTKRAGNSNISDDGTNVTITLGSGGKLVVTS